MTVTINKEIDFDILKLIHNRPISEVNPYISMLQKNT